MSETTENPLSSLFNEPLFEEDVQQLYEPYFLYLLLGCGLFYACLMMAFVCLLNSYTKAFKKHSKLFGEITFFCPCVCKINTFQSPLIPIINHGFRVIKRVYMACGFFMGGIVIFNIYPGRGLLYAACVLIVALFLVAIKTFTSAYPLVISVISLQIAMKSRLSRRRVIWFTVLFYGFTVLRDLALVLILVALRLEKWYRESNNLPMTFETVEPSTISLGYQTFQTIYTACSTVVMLTQFWLGRKPASSLPENILITQTKYIGLVKLVVFIVYGICLLTGFQTILAYAIFLSIDWILVPLVIEITEIRITPSVVKAERMESQQPDA